MPDPILDLILRRSSATNKLKSDATQLQTMASPAFSEFLNSDEQKKNAQSEIENIDMQIYAMGYNPDVAQIKIGDLPDNTPDHLVRDLLNTENKTDLARRKAAIKWQAPVANTIESITDPELKKKAQEEMDFFYKGFRGSEGSTYQTALSATQAARDIINKYNGTADKDEMLANLRFDSEYGLAKMLLKDPLAQKRWDSLGLNQIQGIALDLKNIFEPNGGEFEKQITLTSNDPSTNGEKSFKLAQLENEGVRILGNQIDYLMGKNAGAAAEADTFFKKNEARITALGKEINSNNTLSDELKKSLLGFQKEYSAAIEGKDGEAYFSPYNFDVLKSKVDDNTANPNDIRQYNIRVSKLNQIVEKYKGNFDAYNETSSDQSSAVRDYNKIVNTIKESYSNLEDNQNLSKWAEYIAKQRGSISDRYPEYKQIQLEGLVKDIAGDNVGLTRKTSFRIANSIAGEAVDGIRKVWNNLTIWDGDKLREVEMGDAYRRRVEDVIMGYETGDQMLKDERSIIPIVQKNVQEELDKIKNSKLSEEEKYQQNYKIVSKAFDDKQIQYVANPKYGKYNITSDAILNTISSVTSQFLGQMAQAYLSGGFGNVSKLRRLATLFGTTAAQTYSREYDAAVQRGDANPSQQATVKSFIEGLSELPFDNIQFVKNMSPQFRRIAGDMTQAEWAALKAGKLPKNLGKEFAGAIESLTKEGALEEGLAQVGGNIADKYMFGKDKDISDGLDVSILAGVIGFAPLSIIGLPMKYRSANMGDKLMMYHAGFKADQVIANLNQQVIDGDITAEEAKQRTEALKTMKEVVGGMSMYDVNGKPLTDNQKAQYAWNEYVKIKSQKIDNLPSQQKKEIEEVVKEADQSSSNILNGTDNATNESARPMQGMPTEGSSQQSQAVGEGQQGQEQATQPTANVGYSDISGQEVDLEEAPQGLTEVAAKVFNDAIQIAKSFVKSGIKVRVFQNQADFERESAKLGQQARGQGVFMADGKNILINLSKIKDTNDWGIVWHEGAHPVMNIIRNSRPKLYNKMAQGFGNLAKQGGVFAQVQGWAQSDYGGKNDVSTDEAMVETVSLIGDGKIGLQDIPVSFRQQVIDFVNSVADYLGLGQLADTSERVFTQKAAQIAQTLRSGGDIASVVGAENVGMTQSSFAQQKIDSKISDEGVSVERKDKVPLAVAPSKEAETMRKIDELIAKYPKAITNREQWKQLMSRVFSYEGDNGQVMIPAYPEGLGRMASSVDEVLKELEKVSPEQRKLASDGLKGTKEIGEMFKQGKMDEVDTGLYFLWNIMSIGISPYPQESGFLQAVNAGVDKYLKAAAEGSFDNAMLDEYLEWVSNALPLGTPGAGSKSNLNAFGKNFLSKASEVIDQGEFAGKTKLQALHEILSDRTTPTNELRRKWQANMSSMSFNNKIFDFILLTTGRSDLFVIDRVRVDHFWDGDSLKKARGLKSGTVIYDGAELTYKASSGAGFSKMLSDVPGLIFAELANRTMTPVVKKAYQKLGVTESPDVGRFHWETWVAASAQEVSHGSIDAIVQRKDGGEIKDAGIRQGKYGAWDFNFTYRKVKGQPFRYEFTDSNGNIYIFKDIRFVKNEIDNQSKKNYGTEETRFLLADTKGNIKRPTGAIPSAWYDQPSVNSQKYFDFLRSNAEEIIPAPNVIEDQGVVIERNQERNSSVFAAPFYDLSLRDQPGSFTTKADEARGTEAYQQYENDIKEVAQLLGVSLEDVEELIGGFENEQGKKIVEVAAKSNIEVDDFNKAIQFAAILGAIAPETQESTIAARYVEKDSPEHNANEHTLKVSDVDLAIQALTDIGVYNFSVNESTNEVTILNIFAYPTNNIDDILDNFASKLKEYGVKYEAATNAALQSEYIDYGRRKEIIADLQGTSFYGQTGQRLRDVIAQAEQRNEEFIRSKQKQERQSAVVLAEMDSIVADAKANGSYLIAPNGNPTKLSPNQWATTRTNNFKNWFGDWQNDSANASNIVDDNGEPLVVYHNSAFKNIQDFKGYVTYFTDNAKYAESVKGAASPNQYEVFLNIRNPYNAPSPLADVPKEVHDSDQYTNPRFIKIGNSEYDSVIGKDAGQSNGMTYAVFSPNQIKSALDNNGKFNSADNRIQERKASAFTDVVNGFYSPIEDRINTFKQTKASVQKWKDIVGVKSDEAVYSGMSDWLGGMKPDQQLSKEDVLKFMKDNRIEIKEISKQDSGDFNKHKDSSISRGQAVGLEVGFGSENEIEITTQEGKLTYNEVKDERDRKFTSKNLEIPEETLLVARDLFEENKRYANNTFERNTKYSDYQLPGGENYKEILITLPSNNKALQDRVLELEKIYENDGSNYNRNELEDAKKDLANSGSTSFRSTHFDEPNIITHLRMNNRTDTDGKKVLFLEEVQSDWGQKGKREGFGQKPLLSGDKFREQIEQYEGGAVGKIFIKDSDVIYTKGNVVYSVPIYSGKIDMDESGEVDQRGMDFEGSMIASKGKDGVPVAPYVTNTNAWVKLGLKVALKEAVKQGADRIAWTTGEQQNERYDLSKSIDEIQYVDNGDGTYSYSAIKGKSEVASKETADIKTIEAELGKDIADKMLNSQGNDIKVPFSYFKNIKSLTGQDLKVGGKGMKAFYGDANNTGIVGNVAKALVKELTGKEGSVIESKITTDVKGSKESGWRYELNEDDLYDIYNPSGELVDVVFSERDAQKSIEDFSVGNNMSVSGNKTGFVKGLSSQPAIDITPELAASIPGGVAQFKNSSVDLINDGIQNRISAAVVTSKAIDNIKDVITKLGYGYLPEDVREKLKTKQRIIDADINEMNVLNKRLEVAIRNAYGIPYKKLDASVLQLLDKALRNFEGETLANKTLLENQIPEPILSIIEDMRSQIDSMSLKLTEIGVLDNSLEPSFDGEKGLGVYVNRTYKKYDDPEWVSKIPEPVRDRAIQYLKSNNFIKEYDDKGNETGERELTDEEVEGLVNYIATNMKPVMEGLSSANAGKTKLDILKGRKQIPEEIRDLMGEYKDPMVNFARSIVKMSTLINTHQTLKAIASENIGKIFFKRPTGKSFVPVAGEDESVLQPLSGLYATQEIADAFKNVQTNMDAADINFWMLRTLAKINGIVKIGKTALSPASWVRNVIGGHIMMIKDGHIFGDGYAEGWKSAIGYFANKSKDNPAFQSKVREYIEQGILGDGVQAGEFQAIIRAAQKHDNPMEWLQNDSRLGKMVQVVKGFYSAQDDIFRVWAYENEKSRLKSRKAGMTETELQAVASRKARATYPTYSELPEAIRQLAKFIPMSSFPAFSAELIRTTKNSFKIAFEEIGDPDMRDVGIKRLAGVISAIGFGSVLAGASAMLIGVGPEEEKAVRRYLPSWSRNSPLIWLGRDDNGMPMYIDLGFSDPFSYFKKPFVALTTDNEMSDRIKNAAGELASPFISPEIFLSALVKGGKKLKETDDLDEVMGKYAGPVFEALEPGISASLRRIGKGLIGDVDRYGQQYDAKLELVAFFSGQRIKKFDVPVGFSFKSKEFVNAKRDIMSNYYIEKSKTLGDPVKEAKELDAANQKFEKYYNEFKKDYDAALILMSRNMSVTDARRILKNILKDRNVPNVFIKSIEKNKSYPKIEDDK